ncbi:zinc finger MYM-type protein 6-like [Clavelina lepadiformis]|uniref:zinc finger MYM-type protein 6-like n=1 Tax=Clavelina lepadiformis TaxID=159417 RepID=UPI0040411636
MIGCHSGVTMKIKEVANKDLLITHCVLHRENLSDKKLSPGLKSSQSGAVKIINYIRSRALHSRLFEALCDSIEDIFSRFNDLNSSLQGNGINIFTLRNKIDAFKKKLMFWNNNMQKGDIDMFPCLQDVVANASVNTGELFADISQRLEEIRISFEKYFPENADPRKGNFWIVNPFANDNNSCNLNTIEKESLIELSCDTTLLSKHKDLPFSQFWISLKNEYSELTFHRYLSSKTKQRSYVEVDAVLRLAETSIEPQGPPVRKICFETLPDRKLKRLRTTALKHGSATFSIERAIWSCFRQTKTYSEPQHLIDRLKQKT